MLVLYLIILMSKTTLSNSNNFKRTSTPPDINSQHIGVSSQLLQKLQVVQNAAARLVTEARRCERMTPVFCELHWLPIRQQITFKTAVWHTSVNAVRLRSAIPAVVL